MKITVRDVEDGARTILLDTDTDHYRFTPKEMHLALHDALKHIRNVRPESKYVNCVLTDLDFPANLGNTDDSEVQPTQLNMEDRWREAAVYYIVHRMYLKDDADTSNAALADRYLNMFNASVMS